MNIFGNSSKVRELELQVSTLQATIFELQATIDKNAAAAEAARATIDHLTADIFQIKATNEKNAVEIAAKDKRIDQLAGAVEAREREITRLLNEAQLGRR